MNNGGNTQNKRTQKQIWGDLCNSNCSTRTAFPDLQRTPTGQERKGQQPHRKRGGTRTGSSQAGRAQGVPPPEAGPVSLGHKTHPSELRRHCEKSSVSLPLLSLCVEVDELILKCRKSESPKKRPM